MIRVLTQKFLYVRLAGNAVLVEFCVPCFGVFSCFWAVTSLRLIRLYVEEWAGIFGGKEIFLPLLHLCPRLIPVFLEPSRTPRCKLVLH